VIAAAITHFQSLDSGGDKIFGGHLDFKRVGLLGHSRGAEAVLVVPELSGSRAPKDITVKAVLSLAPTNARASSETPRGFAFMTILPAGDGDVRGNDGAVFYDNAVPSPCKSQLYIHEANHNFFNTEWVARPDRKSGAGPMLPADHQRILLVYACALFRSFLTTTSFERIVAGRELPPGVRNDKIHISSELAAALIVEDHQDGTPGKNTLLQTITKFGYATADEKPFSQTAGAFNGSFFGASNGLIVKRSAASNQFTSPLKKVSSLKNKEVWIRSAEVYTGAIPANATGFKLGLVDVDNKTVFVDSNETGGLPRPFDRRADDLAFVRSPIDKTKTMLKTFRFPIGCFERGSGLKTDQIKAIVLHLDRGDNRELAFDQWQIV